ncbi:hypothetical protein FRC12_022701 [Ceratobasidium sp. 428]|nr:hypothetical protein FRC12_022701 [Ceratobasidium sp. 428]
MSISINNMLDNSIANIAGRKRSASCFSDEEHLSSRKRFVYSPSADDSYDSLSTLTDSDIKTETDSSYYEVLASPAQVDSPYLWHWLPPFESSVTAAPQTLSDEPGYFPPYPVAKGVGLGLGPIVKSNKKRGIYGDKPRRPISQPHKIPYPIRGFSTSSPLLPSSPVAELRYPNDKPREPMPLSPVITSPLPGTLDPITRYLVYSFNNWQVPTLPAYHIPSPDPNLHLPPIHLPSLVQEA